MNHPPKTSSSKQFVIWCSVSSKPQTSDDKISLPEQERLGREYFATTDYANCCVLYIKGYSRRESNLSFALKQFREQGITAYDELERMWEERSIGMLWAYSHSRFGRSSTLYTHVVENTILSGAKVYLHHGGMVEMQGMRFQIALGQVNATADVDRLVAARKVAMKAKAQRGLPTSSRALMSHRFVRNDSGKIVGYELRPELEQFWIDVATLLIDQRVPWNLIEFELEKQFGYINPSTGKRYSSSFIWSTMHTPIFWGHLGVHYSHQATPKRADYSGLLWAIDERFPAPPETEIYYNRIEPVYKGELAMRVKAEIIRRTETNRGRSRPNFTHMFSGLVVCDECLRSMSIHNKRLKNGSMLYYMSCPGAEGRFRECPNNKVINYTKLKAYFTFLIEQIRDGQPLITNAVESKKADLNAIQKQLAEIEDQIRALIRAQITAPDNLQGIYSQELQALSERKSVVERRLRQEESGMSNLLFEKESSENAVENYVPEVFWDGDSTKINQELHKLMGGIRLMVRDGKIVRLGRVHRRQLL